MDINAAVGSKQLRIESFAGCAGDHVGTKRNEPERVVAAMPVGAAKPMVQPPEGQFAARVIRLGDAQSVHPVVSMADHQCPNRRPCVIGQCHHMPEENVMRVVRNNNLSGVCTGNPCDW